MRPLKNCELIEVPVNQVTVNTFQFPDNKYMAGKYITAIEAFSFADYTKSPLSGAAVVNTAAFKNSVMILSINQRNRINKMPIPSLQRSSNNSIIKEFDIPPTEWTQNQIVVGDLTTLVLNEVYLFCFYYEDYAPKHSDHHPLNQAIQRKQLEAHGLARTLGSRVS